MMMINDNDFILIKREIAKIKAKKYKTSYHYELNLLSDISLDYALCQVAVINLEWLFENTYYFIEIEYLMDFENYIHDKDNYLDQWLVVIDKGTAKEKGLGFVS